MLLRVVVTHKKAFNLLENRVLISGLIHKIYDTRYSPAGIPMTRFILDHQSEQSEAGLKRNIRCKALIIIAGTKLHEVFGRLQTGQQITVAGYLSQVSYQGQNPKLCVNAESIKV
ncbi:MAG TPA: primosomal replication protein N [Gammaproteobacteria bacterium]|nr:primosomal replication protein N [Gammaproteobacteria bacterium]